MKLQFTETLKYLVIVTLVIAGIGVVYSIVLQLPRCYTAYCITKTSESLLEECDDCFNRIDKLERENSELSKKSDQIIRNIFNRICEIEKDDPDEIRGAVIESVKDKLEYDVTTRKASVLALLINYKELNDDPEIQKYLMQIENADAEINKNIILVENYAKILESCSDKIDQLNHELD